MNSRSESHSRPAPLPVIVHIGTEKTGSTAIQTYLKQNQDALLEQHGTLVPRSLGAGACVNLAAACQRREPADSLRKMRGLDSSEKVADYYTRLLRELKDELVEKQPQRLLLSCENFSSRLQSPQELEALRDFLMPLASSIRIIVYLRDQAEMIASSYTTKLRNGYIGPFIFPPQGAERPDSHYDALLDNWAGIFGAVNIEVRLYEKQRLLSGDIVNDFCAATNLPIDLPRSVPTPNSSPDANTLELLRRLNALIPHRIDGQANPLRGDLADAVSKLSKTSSPGEKPQPHPMFKERFDAGNRAVAAKWFAGDSSVPPALFKAPGETAQSSGDETDIPEPAAEDLIAAAAHLWKHAQGQLRSTRLERDQLKAELLLEKGHSEKALEFCLLLNKRYPENPVCERLLERARALAGID